MNLLIQFEAWKYVDPFFNKQGVFHKLFVMEGEPVNSEFCIQVPEWLSKLMSRGKQLLLHNDHVDSAMIMRCFMALCSVSEISHFMWATFSWYLKWKLPSDEKYFRTLRTLGRMEPPNYMGLPGDFIDDFCVTFRKMWKCCSQGRLLWMKIKWLLLYFMCTCCFSSSLGTLLLVVIHTRPTVVWLWIICFTFSPCPCTLFSYTIIAHFCKMSLMSGVHSLFFFSYNVG